MRHAVGGVLLLLLAVPLAAAEDKPEQKPKSPREQYQALLKESQDAMTAFAQAYQKAETDEARQKVLAEKYPRPDKVAAAMTELAEKNPRDPVALDALVWVLTNQGRGPGGAGKTDVQKTAARLVRENFLDSDKLGPVCRQLASATDPDVRALLQAIREKSPHKAVQAEATLAQAMSLNEQIAMVEALKREPEVAKQVEAVYGKAFVENLQKADPADLEKQAAGLLQEVADKYASGMKPAELARTVQMLGMRGSASAEPFLRTLMDKDARDEVKGLACLTLGQVYKEQADAKPDQAEALQKKAEALFEQAAAKFADVKTPFGDTVGAKAKSELFDLRHLAVGKTAPEVEGQDQDGQKFKLSDYRGKVVLLDFWSQF